MDKAVERKFNQLGKRYHQIKPTIDSLSEQQKQVRTSVKQLLLEYGDHREDGGRNVETDDFSFQLQHKKSLRANDEACAEFFKDPEYKHLKKRVAQVVYDAREIENLMMEDEITEAQYNKLTTLATTEATVIYEKKK